MSQPVRLYYPLEEENYNSKNNADAKARVEGYNWHKRMWWDTKDQNYTTYPL